MFQILLNESHWLSFNSSTVGSLYKYKRRRCWSQYAQALSALLGQDICANTFTCKWLLHNEIPQRHQSLRQATWTPQMAPLAHKLGAVRAARQDMCKWQVCVSLSCNENPLKVEQQIQQMESWVWIIFKSWQNFKYWISAYSRSYERFVIASMVSL